MHVAVAGWWLAQGPSGANRRLVALLRAAAEQLKEGERITLLAPSRGAPEISGVSLCPVEIPTNSSWRRARAERRLLAPALQRLGATVLDLASLPVPRNLPCPVSLTIHDLRDLGPFRRRPLALSKLVLRHGMRCTAEVIVPSTFTADQLREAIPRLPRVTVVPGGVDDSFFASADRASREPVFLHVGHLEPRKNLAMLLEAYARHRSRAQQLPPPLYLVGADHGDGAALRSRAGELKLNDSVRFCGMVDEPELRDLYSRATAVLIPSRHEGFGLPALEGLAAGVPVVVSDRGALPEVVGSAATILPADDADAWALAMGSRQDTSVAARQARARTFTWRTAAAKTLEVWRRLSRR